MSVTKTTTVNKALTLCGAAPISNITDDTNNARIVDRVYEIARKSILCECLWSFATTRCTLTITAATIAFYLSDENYVYARPSGALRIFETSDQNAVWREEGDLIISDTASLGVRYIYDHDSPDKYPAYFLEAFIDKLCVDICYMIINSTTKADSFLQRYYKVSLPAAKSMNSQTGTQQQPLDDLWTGAKLSSGNPARSYD
jgi:hypothetical protein